MIALEQHDHIAQRPPLVACKFVGADQADADSACVEVFGMRADFADIAPGGVRAVGVNNEVVADGVQLRIKPLTRSVIARESAFLMPLIDLMHVMPAAVRRCCAVNDDTVDVPCFHAAMMAAGGGLGKAEGVPGDAGLRLRIGYYLLGGLSIDQLFIKLFSICVTNRFFVL